MAFSFSLFEISCLGFLNLSFNVDLCYGQQWMHHRCWKITEINCMVVHFKQPSVVIYIYIAGDEFQSDCA